MLQPVTDTGVTIINITTPLRVEDESSDNTGGEGWGYRLRLWLWPWQHPPADISPEQSAFGYKQNWRL